MLQNVVRPSKRSTLIRMKMSAFSSLRTEPMEGINEYLTGVVINDLNVHGMSRKTNKCSGISLLGYVAPQFLSSDFDWSTVIDANYFKFF